MELTVRPHHKNEYPLKGIVVRGESLFAWLGELQSLGLSPGNTTCYPLPGIRANSLWGCLFVPPEGAMPADIGRNSYCQRVHPLLFIPEYSQLSPLLTTNELLKLVKDTLHFFHPSVGWVELTEPLDWEAVIDAPPQAERILRPPAETIVLPGAVRSFQVLGLPPEEVLEKLDAQLFPEKQNTEKGPLSAWEKIVLSVLRLFFSGPIPFMKGRADSDVPGTEERKGSGKWLERLEKKMTDLEERNKMEVDKLLDLFKKNPDEALKYAIPLDSDGTSRGRGGDGVFSLVTRWLDLSPFGRSNPAGGGGTVRMGDEFLRLNQQYQETARKLVKEGDYSKAAFIYLRLLKNYTLAAQTLEEGGLYGEAASVYLRYNRDKTKAAECYEKGGMVQPAIELYKELGKEEKVGDLYRSIDRREEANHYFEKVAGDYTARGQYMKASVVVRNKMEDDVRAQALLMDGWRNKKDAVNCLTGYFSHLRDEAALMDEMRRIYEKETDKDNRVAYLQVMKHTYQSREAVAGEARSIAYEIVAGNVAKDPSIVAELQSFNRQDKNIISDILKFKHSRR